MWELELFLQSERITKTTERIIEMMFVLGVQRTENTFTGRDIPTGLQGAATPAVELRAGQVQDQIVYYKSREQRQRYLEISYCM